MSQISSATSANSQLLREQVQVAVQKKAQDAVKAQGDAAMTLLEAALDTQREMARASEAGKGRIIDVVA